MSARITSINHNARAEKPTKGGVITLRINHELVARTIAAKHERWLHAEEVRKAN